MRDSEHTDPFSVNPFGMQLQHDQELRPSSASTMPAILEGTGAVNGAAVAIHCAVHAARPDVVAAARANGPYGEALSSLDMTVEPLTQDACAFQDDVGVYAGDHGVVLDSEEGERIGRALGSHMAVILRNHGMLTVGHTIDSAAWWFLTLERTCQSQLMACSAAAGTGKAPTRIRAEEAAATQGQVGFELADWFQFQPIWERLRRDDPDIFDIRIHDSPVRVVKPPYDHGYAQCPR